MPSDGSSGFSGTNRRQSREANPFVLVDGVKGWTLGA